MLAEKRLKERLKTGGQVERGKAGDAHRLRTSSLQPCGEEAGGKAEPANKACPPQGLVSIPSQCSLYA